MRNNAIYYPIFFDVLTNGINELSIDCPHVFFNGASSGVLWGGNLSTIQSLCGLDFLPDKKFIFVAEDINEPVYKIDKMFTQLLNIPAFKNNLSAVVLGDFPELITKDILTSILQNSHKS